MIYHLYSVVSMIYHLYSVVSMIYHLYSVVWMIYHLSCISTTISYLAAQNGQLESIRYLVGGGANVNQGGNEMMLLEMYSYTVYTVLAHYTHSLYPLTVPTRCTHTHHTHTHHTHTLHKPTHMEFPPCTWPCSTDTCSAPASWSTAGRTVRTTTRWDDASIMHTTRRDDASRMHTTRVIEMMRDASIHGRIYCTHTTELNKTHHFTLYNRSYASHPTGDSARGGGHAPSAGDACSTSTHTHYIYSGHAPSTVLNIHCTDIHCTHTLY
jgi:hypothetical protein